jgi:hypothetical protein
MRADLKAALQERWQAALRERARISPRSCVGLLDVLLVTQQSAKAEIGPRLGPDTDLVAIDLTCQPLG